MRLRVGNRQNPTADPERVSEERGLAMKDDIRLAALRPRDLDLNPAHLGTHPLPKAFMTASLAANRPA